MRTLVVFALLAVGVLSESHQDKEKDEKIIQGYNCFKNNVRYQVSLRDDQDTHFCGGALISNQWVVSSAQCYRGNFKVVLGEHDLTRFENTEQFFTAQKIISHPLFNPVTLDNDIMLIKLANGVSTNSYIQPVPWTSGCVGDATTCLVSGWGITLPNDADSAANTLQCLDSPTISHNECSYYYSGRITPNMFCAGRIGAATTCKGDEGGPLVCNGYLQGIVSWGNRCGVRNNPWVYTKVCRYSSWMQTTINNN